MILKRLKDNVAQENWFAVTVEIIVVVLGIFLGMQVTEWNEERKERNDEAIYMERLVVDLEAHIRQMEFRKNYFEIVIADAELALKHYNNPKDSDISPMRLVSALYNSSSIYPFNAYNYTYDELMTTGKINLLRDLEMRGLLAEFFFNNDQLYFVWNINPENEHRDWVRTIVPQDIKQRILTDCELSDNGIYLFMKRNCEAKLAQDAAKKIVKRWLSDKKSGDLLNRHLSRLNNAYNVFIGNTADTNELIAKLRNRERQQ